MDPLDVQRLIETGLPGAMVRVSGDGRHFQALIVSDAFLGKSTLQRHRLVYGLLHEHLKSEALHALSLRTLTSEQWSQESD